MTLRIWKDSCNQRSNNAFDISLEKNLLLAYLTLFVKDTQNMVPTMISTVAQVVRIIQN